MGSVPGPNGRSHAIADLKFWGKLMEAEAGVL
jgi:hypothetical protein